FVNTIPPKVWFRNSPNFNDTRSELSLTSPHEKSLSETSSSKLVSLVIIQIKFLPQFSKNSISKLPGIRSFDYFVRLLGLR
ncbi:TPA: hypothetical protein ACR6NZ_005750, partial [Klebsiella pneumoniae]